ncbi:hypothetical protein [Alkalihalobacillus sp. LMS39]|uniref:hypothetical protein n=1 Tax=Alkalihalobacillus sp. LMS39 TaxID=2924032 RepID=UPI001FB45366|nr:hypothetical protein [Alkalihalobacillus sp. LMS39]UOE95081.1 hypothetical protein MM271_05470 [Alkalihalobacillus sp. LMS39]
MIKLSSLLNSNETINKLSKLQIDKLKENLNFIFDCNGDYQNYNNEALLFLCENESPFNEIENYIFLFPFKKTLDIDNFLCLFHKKSSKNHNKYKNFMEVFPLRNEIYPFTFKASGYVLLMVYIEKYLNEYHTIPELKGYTVRMAEEKDIINILECLKMAYLNGLKLQNEEYSIKKLENHIIDNFQPLLTEERVIFVCETNEGVFCGHALYEVNSSKAEHIDTYTVKQFEGKGLAKFLSLYSENELFNIGVSVVKATIKTEGNIIKLIDSFSKTGWNPTSYIYKKQKGG